MINVNNMKYSDFEVLCENLKKCLDEYSNSGNYYQDMYYTLYLSNGDKFNYSIPKKAVAHLLGINTEEIKLWNFYQNKSSYALLNLICNNTYDFHNKMKKNNKSYKSFISQYIDNKIRVFDTHFKAAREKINDIEFVCKYNRSYAYITGNDAKNIEYVIASRDENFMTLLGLVKDNDEYVPITSQMIDLKTEEGKKTLSSFIRNQVLTLPETLKSTKGFWDETGFFYDDILLQKLENLEKYKKEYGCIIDVSHAFAYSKKKEIDSRVVAVAVCESMTSGNPVEEIEFKGKVPRYLQDLLMYTNSLRPISRKEEIKKLEEFREMALEIKDKQEKLESLQNNVDNLTKEIMRLNEENNTLRNEIEENNRVYGEIKKLILNREKNSFTLK